MPASGMRLALVHALNTRKNRILDHLTGRATIFHASNQVRNPPTKVRLTSTVYDATSWLVPEAHLPSTVNLDKLHAQRILRRADGLIAVSECSKRDAVEHIDLNRDKVSVIHHGVSERIFGVTPGGISRATHEFAISKPYVLFVSTIEPRKNVDRLVDGYLALPDSVRAEYDLIVAGPPGWNSRDTLARLRSQSPGIRYLGYVAERLLPRSDGGSFSVCLSFLVRGLRSSSGPGDGVWSPGGHVDGWFAARDFGQRSALR